MMHPGPRGGQETVNSNDNNSPVWRHHPGPSPLHGVVKTNLSEADRLRAEEELAAARDQWDEVDTITPGLENVPDDLGDQKVHKLSTSAPITFNEALNFYQTADVGHYKNQIKTCVARGKFASCWRAVFGPPNLLRDLHEERDLYFVMALCPLQNDVDIHIRVLQTIYKTLTGSKFDGHRYGDHWEMIGFQGLDPATDLRGTGFLSLMNILHFVTNPSTVPIARDLYRLSQHETQNFPFCVMGINITRLCLQALREGCLNRECNGRRQVLAVMNDFYVASYFKLFQIWKQENKTIAHSGQVLKAVERCGRKNPRLFLRSVELYRKNPSSSSAEGGASFAGLEELMESDRNNGESRFTGRNVRSDRYTTE